jgi:hypothetical protein
LRAQADRVGEAPEHRPHSLNTPGGYGSVLADALQRGGQNEYDGRVFVLAQTAPNSQNLQQDLVNESQ